MACQQWNDPLGLPSPSRMVLWRHVETPTCIGWCDIDIRLHGTTSAAKLSDGTDTLKRHDT